MLEQVGCADIIMGTTKISKWFWVCNYRWNHGITIYIFKVICDFSMIVYYYLNTFRPRQYGRHFTDDMFKCIFLNENARISIKTSLKFVSKDPINNIPALVQIMAWRRPGDKPLSEPMMVSLLTHISVTRPQWVNTCVWCVCGMTCTRGCF